MAVPRWRQDECPPVYQTTTSTRHALEPRDDCARLPKNTDRALRPRPLNIPPKQWQSPPELKGPPPSRKESSDYGTGENLRDPEIVDFASSTTWPQRDPPAQQRTQRRHAPSIVSQRQSEITLGILDYYMRDRTPSLHSPDFPPPAPKFDPAIEKFDFGLPPTPTPSAVASPHLPQPDVAPGANRKERPLVHISPPSSLHWTPVAPKGYSLFPVIKQVTPPPRQPTVVQIQAITPPAITPTPSYRSRNVSTSMTPNVRRIPLRVLSTDSTTRPSASPPGASRWSDDTIISPPSTAGPRTSFGSLLRRDSIAQRYPSAASSYPDCFFEDDDDDHGETEPLRRRWKHSGTATSRSAVSSYSSELKSRERSLWWRKWLLCGCGR